WRVAQYHRRFVPGADGFDRLQAREVRRAGVMFTSRRPRTAPTRGADERSAIRHDADAEIAEQHADWNKRQQRNWLAIFQRTAASRSHRERIMSRSSATRTMLVQSQGPS